MNESVETLDVSPAESVARFVKSKHWLRASDNTLKPDAFMPPRDLNLSVTRRIGLSDEALWKIGREVVCAIAEKGPAVLIGRADLLVQSIPAPLKTEAAPLATNRNHAHITGWPADKAAQKNIAQRLAAVADYLPFQMP